MQNGFQWLTGLVIVGLLMCLPKFAFATPTTNLLIADSQNHRVIEVAPDHSIVWQYGNGNPGSGPNELNMPYEAVKLTNGHILISDKYNYRVIEVQPMGTSGGTIAWEYKEPVENSIQPSDVRKLANNGNVLITDMERHRVLEVTPVGTNSGTIVWQYGGYGTLNYPVEAERRPGTPTPYYLITDYLNHRVIEVQATGTGTGTIVWQYGQTGNPGSGLNQLNYPSDAMRLICGTILIADYGNGRIIEVSPTGASGGTIVWEYSASTGLPLITPFEAVRMSNWNTLIADFSNNRIIEVRTGDYPNFGTGSIVWQQAVDRPIDVEELGIVNIAKAEYQVRRVRLCRRSLPG